MIYGSWFRNSLEKPILGYEQYAPFDGGEGLYTQDYGGNVHLAGKGEEIFLLNHSIPTNSRRVFGKKVRKVALASPHQPLDLKYLEEIVLPNVEEIGENMFKYAQNVKHIFLPKVKVLGASCFLDVRSFNEPLSFPLVERIGHTTFSSMPNLPYISLPKLMVVPERAFMYCSSLKSINLPMVYETKTYAFSFCPQLNFVNLPVAAKVGYGSFYACDSLKTLDLLAVITIENNAFDTCSSLHTLKIPSATTFGNSCFRKCSALKSITCKRGYRPALITALNTSDIPYQNITITEV